MKHLKKLSSISFSVFPRWILFTFVVLAVIGFADATYLTVEHYQNVIPPCSIGGCETVLTSSYATIAGVPVALLGSLYFLALLVCIFLYIDLKRDIFLKIVLMLSLLGLLPGLYFPFLMAFVIKNWCPYCVVSDLISLTLFIIAVYIIKKYAHSTIIDNTNPHN